MTFQDMLTECWVDYVNDAQPKDRRMQVLSDKRVDGMSTENVRFLLNEIVRRYVRGEGCYLEVGSYRGCSLLSAALHNPYTLCIGIDNFCGFNEDRQNRAKMEENFRAFGNPENIEFMEMDFREGFGQVLGESRCINVYLYDGHHDYEDQIMGLEMALPWLASQCIIIVDDVNWPQPEAANRKFQERNPEFKTLMKVNTPHNSYPTWWNGIEVFGRGIA